MKFFLRLFFKCKRWIIEFEELFGNQLKPEDRKILSLFTNKKYCFTKSMKKVFYPKMFRQKWIDEIMLRIIFLIGKL